MTARILSKRITSRRGMKREADQRWQSASRSERGSPRKVTGRSSRALVAIFRPRRARVSPQVKNRGKLARYRSLETSNSSSREKGNTSERGWSTSKKERNRARRREGRTGIMLTSGIRCGRTIARRDGKATRVEASFGGVCSFMLWGTGKAEKYPVLPSGNGRPVDLKERRT